MADDPKTSKSEDEIEWVSIAEAAERSQQTERNIRLWAVGDAKSKPKFKNVNRLGSGGKAKILLDINEVMEFTKDRAPAEKSTQAIPVSYLDDLKEMMERVVQESVARANAEREAEFQTERREEEKKKRIEAERRLEEEHQRAIAIEDQRLELENRLKAAEANERDEMQKQIDELAALVKKQAEDAEKVTEVVDLREGEAPVKKRFFGLIRS